MAGRIRGRSEGRDSGLGTRDSGLGTRSFAIGELVAMPGMAPMIAHVVSTRLAAAHRGRR
ncbi:hypothetical protein [Xanthomonas translucens]|uniref:hypothetical protein n=1 Tax=Xanthomonas campestris pv. translucens TaxID=343 RepID=UPI000346FEBF|nr:hypothetical protein [Xanthomonas translucens]